MGITILLWYLLFCVPSSPFLPTASKTRESPGKLQGSQRAGPGREELDIGPWPVTFQQLLTNLHDSAKDRRVVHGAAVPAPLSELVLAFLDARLGSLANVGHVLLV